jgi:rubrerythrin
MNTMSLDEIMRFAIRKEADAAALYRMAADRAHPGMRDTFEALATEEEGHKKKLEAFDWEKLDQAVVQDRKGLGIAEGLEEVPFSSDMSYAELLRMAIKTEEKSFKLYHGMAQITQDSTLKKFLLLLAQEESTHKERIEKIYDKDILEWL